MTQPNVICLPTFFKMSPLQKELFETIKIENGQIANIEWHNKRCNKARFELYQQTNPLKLQNSIKNVPFREVIFHV